MDPKILGIGSFVAAGALGASALFASLPTQATARSGSVACVNEAKIDSLPTNARRKKVAQRFGTNGQLISTKRLSNRKLGVQRYRQIRSYRACEAGRTLQITYIRLIDHGKVRAYRVKSLLDSGPGVTPTQS